MATRYYTRGHNVLQRTPFGSTCPRGHKVEGANARIDQGGYVRCIACNNGYQREYTRRQRQNVQDLLLLRR